MRKIIKHNSKIKPSKKSLYLEITSLIEGARKRVSAVINSELVLLYWSIGKTIKKDILKYKRAEYGEEIISNLSEQLTKKYGKGWSEKQLRHCLHAVEIFPDQKIVSTLCRQLSWSHIRVIMYLKDQLQRTFYLEMCIHEKWSVRQLQERTESMLYERTALSKKPQKLIRKELLELKSKGTVNETVVFRDTYVFDFLGLSEVYSEHDLESNIIVELQKFITELGSDFAFLARQKRITIDNEDYFIDLLFYHRGLRRMVVIELKLGKFKAAYKGQMELYLRWLEKNEMRNGEQEPIGLILCADKSDEHIELLMMDHSRIKVAQYLTELPSKKILIARLHKAIEIARKKGEFRHTNSNKKEINKSIKSK